jgi:two-component system, OmpR family, response regulator MprA
VRILVVDDEPAVRVALSRILTGAGFEVLTAADGPQALDQVASEEPDAVVLDVLMPGMDGLEVCRKLREIDGDIPVLMLTARDAVEDRVTGLDAGADDYLVKPFALEELLARIRALLRRAAPEPDGKPLQFEDLVLDRTKQQAWRADRLLQLTRTEFSLLELFMSNPDKVLSRSAIFESVWGYDFGYASNSLEVYIGHLRKKTEASGEPRVIHTVRGVGYALRQA